MLSQRPTNTIDLDAACKPRTDVLTRRSISIFSRRGVDSVDLSHSAVMRALPPAFRPVDGNVRQKPAAATPRKSSLKPKKSKGTILNAVPQTTSAGSPSKPLTPVAYVKTVKASSPLEFACTTAAHEATTLKETQAQIIAEKRSPSKRHAKSKSSVDRIGVWVNGVIHWEQDQQPARRSGETIGSRGGSASIRTRPQSDDSTYRSDRGKPCLTVIIPQGKLLTREQSIAALKRPATSHGLSRKPSQPPSSSFPVREVSPLTDCAVSKRTLSRATTVFSPIERSRAASSASQRHDRSQSSSVTNSANKDESSDYSKRSSSTSVEAQGQPARRAQSARSAKSASAIFSIVNPTVAATLDEYTPVTKSYMDKPLPPTPSVSDSSLSFPMPPTLMPISLKPMTPTGYPRPQTARSSKSPRPLLKKAHSFQDQSIGIPRKMSQLDVFDQEFMKTSPYCPEDDNTESECESELDSMTLSQAETELREEIGRMSKHIPKNEDLENSGLHIVNVNEPAESQAQANRESVTMVMHPPPQSPEVPLKSQRREWSRSNSGELSESEVARLHARRQSDPCSLILDTLDAPMSDWWVKHRLSRSVSSAELPKFIGAADFIDRNDKLVEEVAIDDGLIVVSGPTLMRPEPEQTAMQAASQEAAEGVLVKILASLTSIEDLMNAILINKGMHRVYCENERRLVQTVARNESAPAFELRQWLKPTRKSQLMETDDEDDDEITILEQSPAAYVQAWRRDLKIIESLKTMIVASCQSFIRKETVAAMTDKAHPQAQRVTDAFWRIWTFCSIFGSQKGRDEDLIGQLDWLKGGRLANNLDCAATVSMNVDFDVGSILLNAPEYFGSGNEHGLTETQLYDITEIWTCMASLLQGYLGRVGQARSHGVYDNCNIDKDDLEKEEYMLEEWIAWVVTLGPTVVLELAEYASESSSAGVALAEENGWTKWSPPTQTTSRCTFLKEPVARLYEERVTAANVKAQNAHEQAEKEKARRRIAAHAQEIRARRQHSAFKRVPLVDMSMERPMSVMSTLSGGVALTPRFPPRNMTLPPVPAPAAIHPALRAAPALSPTSAVMLQQGMRTPALGTQSSHMAITQHQLAAQPERQALRAFNGVGEGTVELAVQRLLAMGFSAAEATVALKTTDTGDGLRVDRAVDWLLRTRGPAASVKWTGPQ